MLVSTFVAMALGSLLWLPYDPTAMDIPARLDPPSPAHWLGTDQFGRDVLSILLAGARTALAVAVASSALGLLAGVPMGLLAAGVGGLVDEVVARTGDVIFAFPTLLIAVLIAAVAGPGLPAAVAAIGVFNVPVFARVTRSGALGLQNEDFVLAARSFGKGWGEIAQQHILPNLAPLLLVQLAIQLSLAVVAEAGLAYIGLGVQPPTPSWGRMLGEAQTLAGVAPWLAVFPGFAILSTVLAFNLLAAGIRDLLDPRLAHRVREDL